MTPPVPLWTARHEGSQGDERALFDRHGDAIDVAALVPIVPTTIRDFAGSQQVTTFLKIYQGGKEKLADVPLSVRIRDVHDAVVFAAPQILTADRFDTTRAAECRLALPMDKLAPGPYLP